MFHNFLNKMVGHKSVTANDRVMKITFIVRYRLPQYIWDPCDCPIISAHLIFVYIYRVFQYTWDPCHC